MFIKVTPFYEIDAEQIEALAREEEPQKDFPYVLKIITKGGRVYMAKYMFRAEREDEINRILEKIKTAKEATA